MAMRNPAMILAAQGPQMCDARKVGRCTAPAVSGPDVAAGLCSGVFDTDWAAARLVWAMDARDLADLERRLYLAAIDLSVSRRWPRPPRGSARIRRMVHMALLEHGHPASIWVDLAGGKVKRRWSGVLRADLVGMQPDAWRKTWAWPYEEIYQHVGDWLQSAARTIRINATCDEFEENA